MLIWNGHILLLVFEVGLSELAVRTEHIHNLVDVHLLHVLASGLQILTRIEVIGILSQILTDGSSHGQTAVPEHRGGRRENHGTVVAVQASSTSLISIPNRRICRNNSGRCVFINCRLRSFMICFFAPLVTK